MKKTKKTKKEQKYKRLTLDMRITIENMYNSNRKIFSIIDIAEAIGVNRSTVYREIQKGLCEQLNSDLTTKIIYSADKAQKYADKRKNHGGPAKKIDPKRDEKWIAWTVEQIKKHHHSPAATLALSKQLGHSVRVSVKTLYRYIHNGIIKLRRADMPSKKEYSKRNYVKIKRKRNISLPGKTIELRPDFVDSREKFGHFEMDTVVGPIGNSKKSLLVLTERLTRFEIIRLLESHTAEEVVKQLAQLRQTLGDFFPHIIQSITCDNGSEFADAFGIMTLGQGQKIHAEKKNTMIKLYFHNPALTSLLPLYYAHPGCSWERGSNEVANRFIRRLLPKGVSFDKKTAKDIKKIENWMNNYPRKIFDWQSANERMAQELTSLGLDTQKIMTLFANA